MAYNAAQAYGKNKITTASQADLTLMLYDGAVKFCNIAILALEKKDYENFRRRLIINIRLQKILHVFTITYLRFWLRQI